MTHRYVMWTLRCALAVAVCLCACATPRRPAPVWVAEFGSRSFSKDGIEGIGFAAFDPRDKSSLKAARDSAYSDAMKQLTMKLKTTVRGSIERQMRDELTVVNRKHREQSQEVLDSVTQVLFDSVLGRKQFEEYTDHAQKRWWVFCWMTAEEVERTIAEQLRKQQEKNNAIMKSCLEFAKGAEMYLTPGAEKVMSAVALYEEILGQLADVSGIAAYGGTDSISLRIETENALKSLIASIQVLPAVETNAQTQLNQTVQLPLTVKVTANVKGRQLAVEGFPLKLRFTKGAGEVDQAVKTDAQGLASGKAYKFTEKQNAIDVFPDILELAKTSGRFSAIANYKVTFLVAARTLRELKRLYIGVLSPGSETGAAILNTEIASGLRANGFNVVQARASAEYVLEGTMTTEFLGDKITLPSGQVMNFGPSYSGTIHAQLKDVTTGKVLLSVDFVGVKAFGKTQTEAENNSYKRVGASVADYIAKNWTE
jgi:hypothetical protein